jgi:hypothetical protein
MSRLWSTAALLAVLAGLVGYIYFIDAERAPSGTETKEKLFGTITAEDIEEVQIRNADGETSRLQKTDGAWQLVEPVKAAADESELSSIASSLASLEVQRVVDENAPDVKQYGLEPARLEVGFRTKGATELRRVLIGEKTPTGSDLYARSPDSQRVFLVSSFLDSTFNKSAFNLRDRRILVFDRNAVDGLEMESGTFKARLTKSGSEWRLASPLSARADFAAVEGALGRLASTQMQSIADADGKDLAKYGLDRPGSTITVNAGSSRATLVLGGTDNALMFARDSSRPMVFTVAPAIKDDVIRTVADFRRKDLFDSRAFTATRAEIRRGADTVVLEKSKGKDDVDVWRLSGKDVDSAKADDLLTRLTGLRADSFEDASHASLKTPALVVSITFDEKQETVTLARSGTDVFASRSDEPGSAKLAASGLDDVMKALEELGKEVK